MPKPMTADEWSDRYYEQQALHTEATGMLARERDHAKAQLAEARENLTMLRERYAHQIAELRYVAEKAAEWDPENTDNADLAALGAYARAALNTLQREGNGPT